MPGTPAKPITSTRHGVAPVALTPSGALAAEASPVDDLTAGTRIHHYELIRELGRGGMGVVFAARDLKLGRRVAIKFLKAASREVSDRFLAEARATARCNHENVVIIYGADEHAGMPYMVLELIDGQPLRDVMDLWGEGRPMPPSRVVELVLPIARALTCAHDLGIVHRDLKPENVLVTNAGQVKVVDFGIAKVRGAEPGRAATHGSQPLGLTSEGALLGTLPYMSPEQLTGAADHRSDLFATGVILFELLAGRHPVVPMTSEALYTNLLDEAPLPRLRSVVPDVPPALADLVDRCLVKSAEHRLADAHELVEGLESLLPHRAGRRLADGECPYPGLVAFQEGDADRFFGRSRDVARMVARIREQPLTGVVGPSGVGKSSFVRAGVGPALKASGEAWEVLTLRPGRRPLDVLATILERHVVRTTPPMRIVEHLSRRLREEPGALGVALRERARETGSNILLFVDQLEELYTLVPDVEERRAFTAALVGAADDVSAPVRVIVSMRSDLLDRVVEDQQFMDELMRGLVLLPNPDRDSLRDALVQPIELVGYRFETAAIVGEMLDVLAGLPGALPLLQFAAAKLWEARDRDRRLLTLQSYHAIGGISGALATHANDVIAAMSAPAREHARTIFRRLVTSERTRAVVPLAELAHGPDQAAIERVVDSLVAARLPVMQESGSVEIVHESLIDRWPTLRRWLDEDQEEAAFAAQLASAAKQWQARGRPSGLLWRAEAMEEARRWDAQRSRSLPPHERAYLDAVIALGRRGTRRRRIALAAAFVVMSAIAVASFTLYLIVRDAAASERAAREAADGEKAKADLATQKEKEARANVEATLKAVTAANQERDTAKQQAERASGTVVQTREQLEEKRRQLEQKGQELEGANKALEKKRDELEAALKRATAAKQDADRAAAEAKAARDDKEAALRAERQRHEETKRRLDKMTKPEDLR